MSKKTVKFLSLILSVVMLATLLAACGGGASSAPAGSAAAPAESQATSGGTPGASGKDTVVIAAANEPSTLDTMEQNYMMTCVMAILTHSCLVRVGEGLQPEPNLAESWEALSDTEWIFHLREGVKFHDGTDCTAEDVVATIERAKTIAQAKQYVEKIDTVEAMDDYTVRIVTSQPSSSLLVDLTNQQVSILSKEDIDAGVDFGTHINGTGPYKFINFTAGDKIEFEMFDDYFDTEDPAHIKYMTWRFIPEGAARTIALEAGDVDYLYDLETLDVDKLEANPDTQVLRRESARVSTLQFNNAKTPYDNVLFRKAVSCAIDRDSIVKVAMNGFAIPALSPAPVGLTGSNEAGTEGFDLDKAKQYLEESGVDPASVTIPLICTTEERKRAGAIIQANLAELGIEVTIESMDNPTFLSTQNDGNYEAGLNAMAQRSVYQMTTNLYHSRLIGASNATRYNNPEFDALMDKASMTLDPAESEKLIQQAVALLNEDLPAIPLYSDIYVKAYRAGLGGANVNETGAAYYHRLYWE